ncbi:hypothetical protein DP939_32450 [Spongiactinospora rosea]|uniref:DUF418 domain-containing protein n=1 Tax=Spongiactinospora rosea TaxID=2248750 RepID=A0A366LQ56_9ACTN|nr:DUF418 domain-containing protein [Spongiactinospora rosea]RBQ16026.1 hypothetical protein DP939_32450 [Spongiactinospora rosea]
MSLDDLSGVARAQGTAPPMRRARVVALDVLRGFALCGILPANVAPIANTGEAVRAVTAGHGVDLLALLVHQRFFPIFSLLFGIGFSLLLESAGDRVERPRVLLLRRLLVLLPIGLAHMFLLWPGDILTVYALVGLVVLLPSTWLPRWAVAGLGAVLVVASLVVQGGHYSLVPGLFLLGSALTRYGVIARIERRTWVTVVLCAGFAVAAAPFVVAQVASPDARVFTVAGLLLAAAYVTGLVCLMGTPLRPVLTAVFAPLGKMALTNYLSATVIVKVIAPAFGGTPAAWPAERIVLISFVVLAAQWAISTVWLRMFRYGPVEWLWRWATWLRRPPLARRP